MNESERKNMSVEEWRKERARLNEELLAISGLEIKRFLSLDSQVYRDGALDRKTKELFGLVASLVLRCDDCILYHVITCAEQRVTTEEFQEACSVALVVGGSIVIPHLRRAAERWGEIGKS